MSDSTNSTTADIFADLGDGPTLTALPSAGRNGTRGDSLDAGGTALVTVSPLIIARKIHLPILRTAVTDYGTAALRTFFAGYYLDTKAVRNLSPQAKAVTFGKHLAGRGKGTGAAQAAAIIGRDMPADFPRGDATAALTRLYLDGKAAYAVWKNDRAEQRAAQAESDAGTISAQAQAMSEADDSAPVVA